MNFFLKAGRVKISEFFRRAAFLRSFCLKVEEISFGKCLFVFLGLFHSRKVSFAMNLSVALS